MIRKLLAVGTIVCTVAVVGAVTTGVDASTLSTVKSPAASVDVMRPMPMKASGASAALPYHGWYLGHDMQGRVVRFEYYGSQVRNFTINGHHFGTAHVSGDRWHHTCHGGRCTQGHWSDDVTVEGMWNTPDSGHGSHFTAHLYMH